MKETQNFDVWQNLHSVTGFDINRIKPSPIIVDYHNRQIMLKRGNDKTVGLEVGCGIGRNIVYLANNGYCDKFVGLDHTDLALEKARILAESNNCSDQCTFIKGIAGKIFDFKDHSFDFIFDIMAASTFIMGDNNRKIYSNEVKRILKPGGILFIYTGCADGEYFASLHDSRRGNDNGTFRRSMDGTMEKAYTREEIVALYGDLKTILQETRSEYFRAFGEQKLIRKDGFWYIILEKKGNG
jgi:ubiquinone/menaquinone biosynthesis C-methylase UbiE